jgi:segregation and condensation protein A
VFTRAVFPPDEMEKTDGEEEELIEASVFELIEAFHRVVSQLDKKELLEIDLEKLSLTDIINEVMDQLVVTKSVTFEDLLKGKRDRRRIIYTFLAILELIKLRMIKAYQTSVFGVIRIFPAVES